MLVEKLSKPEFTVHDDDIGFDGFRTMWLFLVPGFVLIQTHFGLKSK